MDDTVAERIARNNATFRDANERIRATADEYAVDMERIPFLCECPRPDCIEILPMTRAEYGGVRAARMDGYVVGEK